MKILSFFVVDTGINPDMRIFCRFISFNLLAIKEGKMTMTDLMWPISLYKSQL